MHLGTSIPRHKIEFVTLILCCTVSYIFSIMPRPAPIEEMMRISIYGPKRLLDIPNRSEHIMGLLEKEYVGTKPEDPKLKTLQTVLSEFVTSRPAIIREWKSDDLMAERIIRAHLTMKQLDATSSEISAAMTTIIKEEIG